MIYDSTNHDLIEILRCIPDPRCKRGVRYKFADLLLMCIYSVLAGHSEATEIEYYVELNYEYFKNLIGIKQVPSHDTFSRIMRMVSFEGLSTSLGEWLRSNYPDIYKRYDGYKVLHVDGKAIRAASEKSKGEQPIYHLNAMYEGETIGVYMKRVGEKENEITCLPEFLQMFNLEETIITIDAIGCNKRVIETIEAGKGHYILPVKENQKKLLRTIREEIERLEAEKEFEKLDRTEQINKEHGRIEKIRATMIANTGFIYECLGEKTCFHNVARVGVIDKETTTIKDGKEETTKQRSILITDLERISVENMLKLKLAHWNIEMQHWLLDVQLNEDKKTARKGNAVTSGAILRRFCLMVRKHDPEFEKKPLNRFLMSNQHDITRIEHLLFGKVCLES